MIGERLGSYQVVSQIGEGPVGVVYLAEAAPGRRVAIKVMRAGGSRERLDRALADARGASALRHPSIVEVVECGLQPAGDAYVVMEHIDGPSLRKRLAEGPAFSIEDLRVVTRQIAAALGAAHARRITHGALKPENVFLVEGRADRVKVTDYGVARLAPTLPDGLAAMGGAAAYLSPERCRGAGVVDVNDDVYALGCLMFEMVCGRVPFPQSDAAALLAAHLAAPLPPPRSLQPELPEALDGLILDMLARSPADRPVSMRAVVARLGDTRTGEPAPRSARSRPVSPRLTPLGHAHIRPTEERMIPTLTARNTLPRHTPLGQAHLHLRDLIVEDVPRVTPGFSGVQEGPLPAEPEPESEESPARRKIRRRAWIMAGVLGGAAVVAAVVRALW